MNSTQEKLEQGDNQNCRVFSVNDKYVLPRFFAVQILIQRSRIELLGTKSTLSSTDIDNYQVRVFRYFLIHLLNSHNQKVTTLSPDGRFLAIGGSRDVRFLKITITFQFAHLSMVAYRFVVPFLRACSRACTDRQRNIRRFVFK